MWTTLCKLGKYAIFLSIYQNISNEINAHNRLVLLGFNIYTSSVLLDLYSLN